MILTGFELFVEVTLLSFGLSANFVVAHISLRQGFVRFMYAEQCILYGEE